MRALGTGMVRARARQSRFQYWKRVSGLNKIPDKIPGFGNVVTLYYE